MQYFDNIDDLVSSAKDIIKKNGNCTLISCGDCPLYVMRNHSDETCEEFILRNGGKANYLKWFLREFEPKLKLNYTEYLEM